MEPSPKFRNLPSNFWADVRAISELTHYSKNKMVQAPYILKIEESYKERHFKVDHIIKNNRLTEYGKILIDYLNFRKEILNTKVEKYLMDKDEAISIYESLVNKLNPQCPLPMNKQKGGKAGPAYFTCIINMLIESNINNYACNYDPHNLPIITIDNKPVQVLSRRVDGAFPGIINPISIWEIKEYYNTTTFGSRAADAVYETQVDGLELMNLFINYRIKVFHYLMIDSHYTWWGDGISYLCRMIDLLHMGYVDEILFGREVILRLPEIIPLWLKSIK